MTAVAAGQLGLEQERLVSPLVAEFGSVVVVVGGAVAAAAAVVAAALAAHAEPVAVELVEPPTVGFAVVVAEEQADSIEG